MGRMPGFFTHVLLEKGWRYAYNYLHFQALYNTRSPLFQRLIKSLQPYPDYIEIENTTACSFRCLMCEHTYWDEKPSSMTFEQFRTIVDQFPRLKWIGLTGIGESYLNKDFTRMLRYCAARKILIEIFDIFYYVDRRQAAELVELGVDQIYCSLDAATRATYEKIRVKSDFERVIGNIETFNRIKRAAGKFFPVLDFHFVINRYNINELEDFVSLVAAISPGSKILFSKLLHQYDEIAHLVVDVPAAIRQRVQRYADACGVPLIWNLNLETCKPWMKDCVTWFMPFIFATGEVIPCCSTNEANRRPFQKQHALGNVFTKPFQQIWWGEAYSHFRKQLRRNRIPKTCTDCFIYQRSQE